MPSTLEYIQSATDLNLIEIDPFCSVEIDRAVCRMCSRKAPISLVLPLPRTTCWVKRPHAQKPLNMNIIAGRIGAILVIAGLTIYPQISNAEGFTGEDFAKWSEGSQDSYIETSVTMAGVIFSQTNRDVADCINGWYFDEGVQAERNPQIRETISHYKRNHPSGVIFALIIKECGPLN